MLAYIEQKSEKLIQHSIRPSLRSATTLNRRDDSNTMGYRYSVKKSRIKVTIKGRKRAVSLTPSRTADDRQQTADNRQVRLKAWQPGRTPCGRPVCARLHACVHFYVSVCLRLCLWLRVCVRVCESVRVYVLRRYVHVCE